MLFCNRQSILLGMVMLFGGFLAACQSTPLTTLSSPGISVGITGNTCPSVVVQAGQQVAWTNQDSREHIVRDRSVEGDRLFNSGTLKPGDSFAVTFPQAGSYIYACSLDDAMTGTITIQP